jgi:2,4-dienoyl-CoA reductase-like NADH-dependent reductase (Old Yellow Enzyme family)
MQNARMAEHGTFHYRTLEDLEAHVAALGLDIRFERDIRALAEPVRVGAFRAPNALAVNPMEGCDGEANGTPSDLTRRRYARFAAGGAGLLWFEASAVVPEGRANPRQLWLHAGSVGAFAAMLQESMAAGRAAQGESHRPLTVLQLTHSGRFSRPVEGTSRPVIARHDPYLDPLSCLSPDAPLITDAALEALEDRYVEAARLARAAGFDGVDIKACHGYLVSELLGAFTREGRYGGDYEGRTRFLRNVVAKIRAAVPDLLVATRLNVYDAIPCPHGFGVSAEGEGRVPDLAEPIRLVRDLHEMGVPLVNVSAGNPYYNPHIGRPFDLPIEAAYTPDEHPLEGVARLFGLARQVQLAVPGVACVGTGYSWLRQYLGYAGEANVRNGWTRFVGAGREAFAHPAFADELLREGRIRADRACITCSSCSQLMRDGSVTGCVPRDKSVYSPVFVEGRKKNPGARRVPHPVASHL